MNGFISFIIFLVLLYLGFIINIFWMPQVSGSLFCAFPYLLKHYFEGEFDTVTPVIFPLVTVTFWVGIVLAVNGILFFFAHNVFHYLYSNTGFLVGIAWALVATLLNIGNSEMLDHREDIRNWFRK